MAKSPKYLTFDRKRPVSWSFMSSYDYDPEQWWQKYVYHAKCQRYDKEKGLQAFCEISGCADPKCPVVATTKEMIFGKNFADSIEDGTCIVKELMRVLNKRKEYPFRCSLGKIPLVGFADAFCEETMRKLDEVKTGKKPWDQKRVDEHGQIDMYCLQNWIQNKIRPEDMDIHLYWIPTEETGSFQIRFVSPVKVHSFATKRSMAQVLAFGAKIIRRLGEMEEFCRQHEQPVAKAHLSTCA